MKRGLLATVALVAALTVGMGTAFGADIDLAQKSHIQKILQRGELRVGFESGYLPFEMTNKRGEFIGFDIDFAKRLAQAMGVKFVPVNTAWDGIIPSLVTDKFDIIMSGMTVTQERNLRVSFADPYIVVGQTILLNIKHKDTVKSYKDLNDPKFVITSHMGTTGEQSIKRLIPRATYKGFEGQAEAAMEVINGKADALVYDLPFTAMMYSMHGEGKTVFLDEPFTYEPLAWAINQGDPDFLNFLNNFLRQCKGDGFYERTYEKWIVGTEWQKELD
ncbi:MAG: transporter substrate-binding domain-containing protein [Desulfosarcina sp.]|jgi:polar amino acid transport system substrate-binding protein